MKREIKALEKRIEEMEARSTANALQHDTPETVHELNPSDISDNTSLDTSPNSVDAESALCLSAPFGSLPPVQAQSFADTALCGLGLFGFIVNPNVHRGEPFWLNHDPLTQCDPVSDLEAEDIPGAASVDQLRTHPQPDPQALSGSSERTYLELYFQIINPQWPLFIQSDCQRWFDHQESYGSAEVSFQECFIQLICATGALFCSSFQPSCPHLAKSDALYQQALESQERYTSPNSLARLISMLVQIIYLLHQPDSDVLSDTLATTAKTCRKVLKQIGWRLRSVSDTHATSLQFEDSQYFSTDTTRMVLMTCFTINEVLWSQCSRLIQQKTGFSRDPGAEHTFEIRRLQFEIRRFNRQTAHLPPTDSNRLCWRDTLKAELDCWKRAIDGIALEGDSSVNHRPQTMKKMYDYSLCILFESELLTLDDVYLETLWRAASEACSSFRRIQNSGAMIYFTCSALLAQFRMGMILLACFWLAKHHDRTSARLASETYEAVDACFDTLSKFGSRWTSTMLYRNTFEIVAAATPFVRLPNSDRHVFPRQNVAELELMRSQLQRRQTPEVIIAILNHILSTA
ncbi:unnamed protein product [Clonostachys rhizophaga]|uniref:Transcription factor domain-containing protein n=1 Tax=Clonostachys rhizophaga TaxID=160324 RepID=A0A9N9V6F3_9HYPO|nr:unnamed protein product [Clonostachys rhizophaga]